MSSEVAIVILGIAAVGLLLGLATIPKRLLQPVMIGRSWRLLDDIDRSCRSGRLPEHHPAVEELRELTYLTATVADRITFADVLVIRRDRQRHPDEGFEFSSTEGLNDAEQGLIADYRWRFSMHVPIIVVSGSWLAMATMFATVTAFFLRAARRRILPRREFSQHVVTQEDLTTAVCSVRYEAQAEEPTPFAGLFAH